VQMALMLQAGIALPRAIDVVYRQSNNPYFRQILLSVAKNLQQGQQLSQALSHFRRSFSVQYLAVLKAGESTGRLDKVFSDLARQQKEENSYRSGILSALIYPTLIIVATILVGIYLVFAVIPSIADLFVQQNITLPLATKILVAIVTFAGKYWYLIILAIIAIVIFLRLFAATASGKLSLSQLQLRLPVLKDLFAASAVTTFCRTLAMLIRYGVPIIEATKIAQATQKNILFRGAADDMLEALEKGLPLSKPILENPIYPPLVGQMVMVGEQSGKLDTALDSIADHYHDESAIIIKNLSALVEPILIIVVGLGVAYIVYAVLIPIYQIAQIT